MPTNTADAQEPLYRALDAASEVAEDLPGARVVSMTIHVSDEQQANTLRRYLRARVRAGGQVVGDYGGVEVAIEVAR